MSPSQQAYQEGPPRDNAALSDHGAGEEPSVRGEGSSCDINAQPATDWLITEGTHDQRPCTLHAHHISGVR